MILSRGVVVPLVRTSVSRGGVVDSQQWKTLSDRDIKCIKGRGG